MALLGKKESREEKNARKLQEDMDKYKFDTLSPEYSEAVKSIYDELAGAPGIADALIATHAEEYTKIAYMNALVQQNWIIIKQLDELNKKLDK